MTTQQEITIPQTEFDPENSNFIEVPVGIHNAEIIGVEPAAAYTADPNAKPQLKFTFKLVELENKDGTAPEKWAWCNQVFNPASKLWKWYEAVTGGTPAAGEPFRTSAMLGKPCRVFVNKVRRDTASGPQEFAKIVEVLAPAAPAAAQAKGPTLAQRLTKTGANAERLDTLASMDEDAKCAVPDCTETYSYFTAKGTPFCATHGQNAL